MTGRDETTRKIENKIKEELKNDPQILRDYFYSMTSNTAATEKTYIKYVRDYLKFCSQNDIDYEKATLLDINRYAQEIRFRRAKDGTMIENGESIQRSKLYAIKNFYEFLIDGEIINSNPLTRFKMPKVKNTKPVVYMNKAEINHVKSNIIMCSDVAEEWKVRNMAILSIGCNTGLRVTSISEINVEDLDFEQNCIHVTEKGNKKRVVYFGEKTKTDIINWLDRRIEDWRQSL